MSQIKYDLNKFLEHDPALLQTLHEIRLYEHPVHGDAAPVVAVCNGLCWNTGFYDPWNTTDQEYIREQYEELVRVYNLTTTTR